MTLSNSLAPKPPMGWNSFDAFACRINESDFCAQAEVLASRLLPFGYEYAVIDAQWQYEDVDMQFLGGKANMPPEIDSWGRVLPAPNRFPSSRNGVGFKALADFVHRAGLKFGIHIMRGIPRAAVEHNLPILGVEGVFARDIADINSTCCWNRDMYGIDMRNPLAQAYYDSLLALHAEWGVDFVKADDISMPYRAEEIEALSLARDRCGRPIILSFSPGHTDPNRVEHLKSNCEMWRISNDVWDNWGNSLLWLMILVGRWSGHAGPGHWPDIDMLPFGKIGDRHAPEKNGPDRSCRLTPDEQRTMMTLAAITQSPLMIGADLTRLDEFTFSLLTNRHVLDVNQNASGVRQIERRGDRIVWCGAMPDGAAAVGAFNVGDEATASFEIAPEQIGLGNGTLRIRNAWTGHDLGASASLRFELEPHCSGLFLVND